MATHESIDPLASELAHIQATDELLADAAADMITEFVHDRKAEGKETRFAEMHALLTKKHDVDADAALRILGKTGLWPDGPEKDSILAKKN